MIVILLLISVGYSLFSQPQVRKPQVIEDVDDSKTRIEECYEGISDSGSAVGMPNPSSVFCDCMGGVIDTDDCTIQGKTYDAWEYFNQMNPYDNTYFPSPKGTEAWRSFCGENRSSVYCKPYTP